MSGVVHSSPLSGQVLCKFWSGQKKCIQPCKWNISRDGFLCLGENKEQEYKTLSTDLSGLLITENCNISPAVTHIHVISGDN